MECRDEKYRGLAAVSSPAGQLQTGITASISTKVVDTNTYQPVCLLGESPYDRAKRFEHNPEGEQRTMTTIAVSRRNLLATGACVLVGAVTLPGPATASASGKQNLANEELVRKWYAAWEQKDWGPVDSLLADNFTFTSAAGDDHISKSAFKA